MVDGEAVPLDNLQQGVPLVTLKYIVHILFLRHDYGPSDYGQLQFCYQKEEWVCNFICNLVGIFHNALPVFLGGSTY